MCTPTANSCAWQTSHKHIASQNFATVFFLVVTVYAFLYHSFFLSRFIPISVIFMQILQLECENLLLAMTCVLNPAMTTTSFMEETSPYTVIALMTGIQ